MHELQLTLSINEVNKILETLGQQPFSEVHELIYKIQAQSQQQLSTEIDAEGD